jgi:hypothetical protein
MNTADIKDYAPQARRDFIEAVSDRAAMYGLTAQRSEPVTVQGDVAIIAGRAYPKSVASKRERLEERVQRDGFLRAMEAIAYTWFNRLAALRYMELHGYLDHGYRVLSHPDGSGRPEILDHAAEIDLPGLDRARALELKLDGTKDEELYRLLLIAQCNALHAAMPFLFEKIGDETELLLPANLLHSDSLIRKLVEEIDEELWAEIEIIGWLYQFYISEKKDQVIGKVVESEDIPAATQLFTPNWIVKYLVQNSLGAQWLATYPKSLLKERMEYYVEPAEQSDEVKAKLAAITPNTLNPEEMTLIDPACGSGHILVEAYELFKAIYLERGFRLRDLPRLILEKNLFGLDIDERAAQLTAFALMMKGRADDRRLFEQGVKLNVIALVDSEAFDAEVLAKGVELADYRLKLGDLTELKRLFEHATTFGSLIRLPEELAKKLPALKQLSAATSQDLFVSEAMNRLGTLVRQGDLLAGHYDAVVANPPYMGIKNYAAELKHFIENSYKAGKRDTYAAFVLRGAEFLTIGSRLSMITLPNWMFHAKLAPLRDFLRADMTPCSLLDNGRGVFGSDFGSCAFVYRKGADPNYRGRFYMLFDQRGAVQPNQEIRRRFHEPKSFERSQSDFDAIPGRPLAYWLSERLLSAFQRFRSLSTVAAAKHGMSTSDNDTYLRFWHEVSIAGIGFGLPTREAAAASGLRWFPFNKGGPYRKWYGNNEYVVNWENDGAEIRRVSNEKYPYLNGNLDYVLGGQEEFFRPGVTWSAVTAGGMSMRYFPRGFLFGSTGQSLFPSKESLIFPLLGFLNSTVATGLIEAMASTLHFNAGMVADLPLSDTFDRDNGNVAMSCVRISRDSWNGLEASWDFQSLPLLTTSADSTPSLESSYAAWISQNRDTIAEMKRLEEENNRLSIDAYGLADELTPDVSVEQITLMVNPAYRYGANLTQEEQWTRFREDTMQELVSYAIGCMMGRYSLDQPGLIYAHGGNDGFDPNRYATFPADQDGIVPLTDTDWFHDDAYHRLIEFVSVAWDNSHLEENLTFLADNLSPRRNESSRETLRRYLSDNFFKDHLQMYKRRPIYWLFSSGKQRAFQALVYLHRYNEGTLARMRTEYVVPLQGMITSRIERLGEEIEKTNSTSQRKKLEKERDRLLKQRPELQAFDEKLRHFADRRIALDLDDGVKVNYGKFGDLLAEVKTVTGGDED